MFGLNLGADEEGNPEVIPEPKTEAPFKPTTNPFDMDDITDNMDTSGPTETKKPAEPEEVDEEAIQEAKEKAELQAKKAQAKAKKEEGNVLYKKKELDEAIAKYDEVIFFETNKFKINLIEI